MSVLVICLLLFYQTNALVEVKGVESEYLHNEIKYSIYYPPNYSTKQEYPVLYLLHHLGGNQSSIMNNQTAAEFDSYITSNYVEPMIIVTPNAYESFYINAHDGTFDYEEFFEKEFIPHIEANYPVSKDRKKMAIGGMSMGGYGALYHGIKYNRFGAIAAVSPGIIPSYFFDVINILNNTDAISQYEELIDIIEDVFGNSEYLAQHDINTLVKENNISSSEYPKMKLCVGENDYLNSFVNDLHVTLMYYNVSHQFTEGVGGHDAEYMIGQVVQSVSFVSDFFRGVIDEVPSSSDISESSGTSMIYYYLLLLLIMLL